jgi:LPS-assembly protein
MGAMSGYFASKWVAGGLAACAMTAMILAGAAPAVGGDDATASGVIENADQAMRLRADEVRNDENSKQFVATGHVKIEYKRYVLSADQLTYDRQANKLDASGNVKVLEPDGAIIAADRITLNDDFRDGFIRSRPELR